MLLAGGRAAGVVRCVLVGHQIISSTRLWAVPHRGDDPKLINSKHDPGGVTKNPSRTTGATAWATNRVTTAAAAAAARTGDHLDPAHQDRSPDRDRTHRGVPSGTSAAARGE